MYNPIVDIIIPCYNVEKTIKMCLKSVLNQQYDNQINIYLIDDGSTDNTLSILREFATNKNIYIISNERNLGRAITRNKGIKKGNGEVILFLDSDMTVNNNWVQSHISMLANDNIVGVVSDYILPDDITPNKLDKYLYHPKRGARKFTNNSKVKFQYFLFSNTSIKRNILNNIEMFDESIVYYGGEDTDLAIRVWEKFPNGLIFTTKAPSKHHSNKNIKEFYHSMYIYGNKNLPLLLKKYPQYNHELGGKYINTLQGYLIFNPIIRSMVQIINLVVTNYWITRYLVVDSVIRGARKA